MTVVHIAILFFVLFTFGSHSTFAATHYVEKWGSNISPCSKNSPCLTIQFAIDQAKKNDRVIVGPGVYEENIVIDTNTNGPLEGLKLESTAGRYATIITPVMAGAILRISQSRVNIGKKGKGFTFQGTDEYPGMRGILMDDPTLSRFKIEGNRSVGNSGGGFDLEGSRFQVRYNILEGSGIACDYCERSLISDNKIIDAGADGMQLYSAWGSTIQNNVTSGSGTSGIKIDNESSVNPPNLSYKISNNVVELNNASGRGGFQLETMSRAIVRGNISMRNMGWGFALFTQEYGKPALVSNNLSMSNDDGGYRIGYSPSSSISKNSSAENEGPGFWIQESASLKFGLNNTYGNDGAGSNCGILNDALSPLTYLKHYFAAGDTECGDLLTGTFATKPSKINVRRAASL